MAMSFDVTDQTRTAPRAAVLASVALSSVSLLVSGAALVLSLDGTDFERNTEQRLACLEQPGPNDCGADGR